MVECYLFGCCGFVYGAWYGRVSSNLTLITSFIVSYLTTAPTLFGDTSSPTYWFTSLPCPLLLGPARWYSFNRRLNRLDTTRPPHILHIDRCNYWLITGLICGDMKTPMHILLNFLPIEEYAGNCMGTWYASRIPFPTTTMSFFHIHSKALQSTFNLKLCMTYPTNKPLAACSLFPMQSLKHFRAYL